MSGRHVAAVMLATFTSQQCHMCPGCSLCVFRCVGGGDAGWLRLQLVRIPRGPVVTSAVVFIVNTFPGVQSKHSWHRQVPHQPGQEANLFILLVLSELFISSLKHKPKLLNWAWLGVKEENDSLNEPVLWTFILTLWSSFILNQAN